MATFESNLNFFLKTGHVRLLKQASKFRLSSLNLPVDNKYWSFELVWKKFKNFIKFVDIDRCCIDLSIDLLNRVFRSFLVHFGKIWIFQKEVDRLLQ